MTTCQPWRSLRRGFGKLYGHEGLIWQVVYIDRVRLNARRLCRTGWDDPVEEPGRAFDEKMSCAPTGELWRCFIDNKTERNGVVSPLGALLVTLVDIRMRHAFNGPPFAVLPRQIWLSVRYHKLASGDIASFPQRRYGSARGMSHWIRASHSCSGYRSSHGFGGVWTQLGWPLFPHVRNS